MHYFTHGSAIAAVEDAAQAVKYEAAGWQPVTCDAFVQAWKRRDLAQLADLPSFGAVAPKAGAVLEKLPNGYARFQV